MESLVEKRPKRKFPVRILKEVENPSNRTYENGRISKKIVKPDVLFVKILKEIEDPVVLFVQILK